MHQYLSYEGERSPKIVYFDTCFDSIRTIPTLIHDEHKPEDLDTRGEDHAADADRYFLLSLHERKSLQPKSDIQKKLDEIKRRNSGELEPSVLSGFYQGEFYRNNL